MDCTKTKRINEPIILILYRKKRKKINNLPNRFAGKETHFNNLRIQNHIKVTDKRPLEAAVMIPESNAEIDLLVSNKQYLLY